MLRANVLVVAPDDVSKRLLDAALPRLRQPISRLAPGESAILPAVGECGTLISENVGALPLHDQQQLFDWLTATVGRTQIVSTTVSALLPLVESGAFIEALYYRLNIICIDMTSTSLDVDGAWVLGIACKGVLNPFLDHEHPASRARRCHRRAHLLRVILGLAEHAQAQSRRR